MHLPKYQQLIVDELYNECLKDHNKVILLNGKPGCGKSHIVQALAENLREGWTTFLIEGIDKTLSPYQTLYIGTQLKDKKSFAPNISFGIDFAPLTFSMSPQIEKTHYIFNEHEQAILGSLKAKGSAMTRILIIADNFDEWDQSSKEFLIKLSNHNPFGKTNLNILMVCSNQVKEHIKVDYECTIPKFSPDDYKDIINAVGIVYPVDIADAIACAGENIGLLKLYCEYMEHQNANEKFDINTIIERKIKGFSESDSDHIKNIPPLAIIDGIFSVHDAAYSEENSERKYADVIDIAKKHDFIYGNGAYRFSSSAISDYFKLQLYTKESLLHKDFAMYLKKNRSEDYFARAKHLIHSNNKAHFEEAYYLLCIEQTRRHPIQSDTGYFDEFINNIENALDLREITFNRETYTRGIEAFSKCDYSSAIDCFKQVTLLGIPNVFHAEVLRNLLMSLVLLANDYDEIEKVSKDLFEIIDDDTFDEKEQWVRASIILMSVYTDRVYDDVKFEYLNKQINDIFRNNRASEFFRLMENQYRRRAAMFFAPPLAMQCSQWSVDYFRERYDINEIYKAQCNYGANCLSCGEYTQAEEVLESCLELVSTHAEVSFPSQYKAKNNRALASFFSIAEGKLEKYNYPDEDTVLQVARVALKELEDISGTNIDEVSYVMSLNRVSFLLLLSEFDKANLLIQELSRKIRDEDLFYNFYLNNMRMAYHYLTDNRGTALEIFALIQDAFVPLIKNSNKILMQRNNAIKEIMIRENTLTPFEYNYYYRTKERVVDQSWYFYGRGLLLSDLQFLSL